jgi:hypothetical protein
MVKACINKLTVEDEGASLLVYSHQLLAVCSIPQGTWSRPGYVSLLMHALNHQLLAAVVSRKGICPARPRFITNLRTMINL